MLFFLNEIIENYITNEELAQFKKKSMIRIIYKMRYPVI